MKYLGSPQSGSQAATTASHNRYGQYYRSRAIPVNPNTTQQSIGRIGFGAVASLWRTLDDGQKLSWKSFADANPVTDTLGQVHALSGFAMFMKVNKQRNEASQAPVLVPPVTADAATVTSAGATWTAGVLSVSWSPAPTTNELVFYATGIVSAGRTVPPGGSYWARLATVPGGTSSPQVETVPWVATFGAPPAADQVTFVGVREVANGLLQPMVHRRVVAT